MYQRINPAAATLRLDFEGTEIMAAEGDTVAAALLTASVGATRETAITATPRAPYCLMGTCFECLVEIDGQANQQACLVLVRDGMRIGRQRGARLL